MTETVKIEIVEFEADDTVVCGGCMVNASGC